MLTSNALLQSVRLPFWFACFLAVVGVTWRSPLASVVLLSFCLALLVAIEWAVRRFSSKDATAPLKGVGHDNVQQQIVRSQTAEGRDRLDGTFWVNFPADAMTTTMHIPFCPAFQRVPHVQVFPLDKTDVRIISPKTFGVRVDVKRRDPETQHCRLTIVVEDK